jgi:hypothetical protein
MVQPRYVKVFTFSNIVLLITVLHSFCSYKSHDFGFFNVRFSYQMFVSCGWIKCSSQVVAQKLLVVVGHR